MGKIVSFGFVFSDNKTVYFPGDFVSGHLVVDILRPMKIKEIKIRFFGKAHVRWKTTEMVNVPNLHESIHASQTNRQSVTRNYSATQNLFNQHMLLYGREVNGEHSLPQGQTILPFECQLPHPLPSSFEGEFGYIRYSVKATIVREWRLDCTTKKYFTVLDSLDLNRIQDITNPSQNYDSQSIACSCTRSGIIEVDFSSDRTGYVPGEYIKINANISNSSNSRVKSSSVKLLQTVTFYASSKTRRKTYVINDVTGPSVPKRKTFNWADAVLHIPPLPPSESRNCRIIDIDYSLVFHARLRDFTPDIRMFVPIILGTVPIDSLEMYSRTTLNGYTMSSVIPSAPTRDAISAENSDPPPNYTSQMPPPPSYAAATGSIPILRDEEDGEDEHYNEEHEAFAPRYTYYDWDHNS
uniref:arrestin domain-containing protein 3-like n=1 Tax=Styela clava TaxID=7725 RepID=UPI0019396AB3|nr:arrestin domain-containing protein 3-like [Styela clava]